MARSSYTMPFSSSPSSVGGCGSITVGVAGDGAVQTFEQFLSAELEDVIELSLGESGLVR